MTPDRVLDGPMMRRWVATAQVALRARRTDIDALNVFPIADSDTGTNLLLTWEAAAAALPPTAADEHVGDLLSALARGALLGARGNSGVILCQLLHGLAAALQHDRASATAVASALVRAADEATAAVALPVRGTILTVAAAAGSGASGVASDDVLDVLRAAEDAATAALARTPEQLQVLADAGVVDAGGSGWLLILGALRSAIENETLPVVVPLEETFGRAEGNDVGWLRGPLSPLHAESDSDGFSYEVQYLLAAAPSQVADLRIELSRLGGSLVIVGGDDLWQVHVHVDDAGAAVEAGVRAGIPSRITVTRFADAVDALRSGFDTSASGSPRRRVTDEPPTRSVVAVVPSEGFAALFVASGARALIATHCPTAQALESLVIETGAREVVVVPNGPEITAVAQEVASAFRHRGDGTAVVVVPTISPVQGLSALAVADPEAPLADALVAMAEAAGATRVGEILVAEQTALTNVGTCQAGDVLAMQGGDVVLIGATIDEVAVALIDRMLDGGGELVTLITGSDAPAGLIERLTDHLETDYPLAEVVRYDGGQPRHPLLVGVE